MIKQINRDFKRSVNKFSDIDDIEIYLIFKWAEYEYQSIKILKFKESKTILTVKKIYKILYDNRNLFQISDSAEILKLDIKFSKSAITSNATVNIIKTIKKRKRRAKSSDENIDENIDENNKISNKRKKADIHDKQTI
jgi:hypothetical protein